MIDIKILTETDKGKLVFYKSGAGDIEEGVLKSWNEKYIFVVYPGENYAKREHWEKYTAAATTPEDLFWDREDAECDHQESEMGRCVACGMSTVEDRDH